MTDWSSIILPKLVVYTKFSGVSIKNQPDDPTVGNAILMVKNSVEETLTYCDFHYEHWIRIHTNNVLERLNREIPRRPRVVVAFSDGNSALMLARARLRYVAGTNS